MEIIPSLVLRGTSVALVIDSLLRLRPQPSFTMRPP